MAERSNLDIKQYSFDKGMCMDMSPETTPKGMYQMALNYVLESSEGDLNFLTTEYSNVLKLDLPGKIIHSNLIKQLDIFVLFLDSNEIGVYYPNENKYKTLYKSESLDFNYYVESVSYTKTECEDIVLIFWDGKNRVKNINITKYLDLSRSVNCCQDNSENLDLFKSADTCIILNEVDVIDNASYNVDAGSYMPFIQYLDSDYNTTNYYILNHNIPLIEDSTTENFEYIGGNGAVKLNKAIRLKLKNLDTNYSYINIGFIKTLNRIKTAFIFKERQPVTDNITVDYLGDDGNEKGIDLAQIFTPRAFYLSAKHGLMYNNRLLLAGVKGIKNVNYQKYANKIKVKYVTGKISLKQTKGYKNPDHIIRHKSWMRDENYMLGVVLEFEDMTESAVFPLIGREKIKGVDDKFLPTSTGSINPDLDLCCTENLEYWKVNNTAFQTFNNDFANYLNTSDYCSTNSKSDVNTIKSKGELGYFESEERYPLIKDCDGNYMFPTTKDSSGNDIGQRIRLFKMPDINLEPTHNNIVDEYAYSDNKNRYKNYYDRLEIYPLGLDLEDIEYPTLEETGGVKVTGIRLVYVKREQYNKSILDKGWFVEMFKNSFNGRDYIYPKHNVNSGAKWDYFSNLRNPDIISSNPVTDFVKNSGYGTHYDKGIMFYGGNTLTQKMGINVNHIKIEKQYHTKGYYFDSKKGDNTVDQNNYDPSAYLDKDGRLRRTAIQMYNMYDYSQSFKNKNSNFNIKNICVDNYSYVGDNLILNKISNSEYNLVNFYRESGLYLDFKDSTDLTFNRNSAFFNSDTSSKKCRCGSFGEEYYYNNYIDKKSNDPEFKSCNEGYIYYGSIKNYINSQYGKIEEMQFIDTGLKTCVGNKSMIGFYGDSYINTFSIIRTGVTGMLEDSKIHDGQGSLIWMDKGDPNLSIDQIVGRGNGASDYLMSLYLIPKANVTVINTITESDVNLDLRQEGESFNEVIYPRLAKGKYPLVSLKKHEWADDCFLNSYFYEIICANDKDNCASHLTEEVEYNDGWRNFHDNYIKINPDYIQENGIKPFMSINNNYKTCDCDNEYDNRIIVSTRDNETIGYNGYAKFLKNSFITVPHKEGKITNLFLQNQALYAHTTDTIWKLQVLESTLKANSLNIYLGSNDLLSSTPLNMYISNEGFNGLQDKRNFFQNNYGYFFIDLKSQSVNNFSGNEVDTISNAYLKNFFKNKLNKYFNSYTNKEEGVFRIGFDYRHKRLLLTDLNNSYTLSYYPEKKAWISFHSYIPNFYLQNRDTFFTQTGTSLYLHEDNFNSYRKFNDVHYPSYIQGVVNNNPMYYSTLNNLGFKLDAYVNKNNQLLYSRSMPTDLMVWTDRQHTGKLIFNNNLDENYMSNIVKNNYVQRTEGFVYYNNLLDYVVDSDETFIEGDLFKEPNANVTLNKDWKKIERLNNNYFIYRLGVDNKELENTKFILKFATYNNNLSIR
jgi:hypothetical protein